MFIEGDILLIHYPKLYDCYYPTPKIYADQDKNKQFEDKLFVQVSV